MPCNPNLWYKLALKKLGFHGSLHYELDALVLTDLPSDQANEATRLGYPTAFAAGLSISPKHPQKTSSF